ncbi:hypothetical protein SLE2022_216870 [Rubroshorea leprosula]
MLLLFFLVALPLFTFFLLHKKRVNGSNTNFLPPGPPGLPFIGNLHQLDNSSLHVYLYQLSQKYGPLMSLKLGFRQTLVVSSAKMAKEVLKTHDIDFCSRPALLGLQKLSYNGLDLVFTPYSSYWKEIRKVCVTHLFNPTRSQLYRPIRGDEVSRMMEKISKSSSTSKPINLTREIMCFTNAVICRVAFGRRYEDEGPEMNKFQEICNGTQAMLAGFFVSDYFPLMRWVDRLIGMLSRLEKVYREADGFYQQIIDDHLNPKQQKPEQENIIDVLLKIMKNPESSLNLSFDHIKAVLMNVFVAGTDTSAAAVIWAMTFLLKHPGVMKKAQEEVRNLIGNRGIVDEDDIERLPYLKAVVKETFRLQTVVPLLVPRETIRSCNLGGYEIPAKTLVYVNAWAVGRDKEAWGSNPDAFRPERFLGISIDYKGQDYELIPFGSGRRICPGMYMGAATVELALANLLYKFDWKMPAGMKEDDLDFDTVPGVTVHRKNALCLLVREYKGE